MENPEKKQSPALRGVIFYETKQTLQDSNLSGRLPQTKPA